LTKYAEVLWDFVFNNSECNMERFVFHGIFVHCFWKNFFP